MTNPEDVVVRKRGNKYRLVDKKTNRLVRVGKDRTPVDGGGHKTKDLAMKQMLAVYEAFGRERMRKNK